MSRDRRCRSRAFGFAIESDCPIAGLPPVEHGEGRPTRIEITDAAMIDAAWPGSEAVRLHEEPSAVVGDPHTFDQHGAAGYRLYAPGYGLAQVDPDGLSVRFAPAGEDDWAGLRFLLGRVLPWTAVLRGLEVFHASAVAMGGQAVALFGPSGAGKSALAANLARGGAELLTDDALVVDRDGSGALRAHPGASIASLRVDGLAEKLCVEHLRAEGTQTPRLVYLLTRDEGGPVINEVVSPDPRVLLGSAFVLALRTPERLRNQLEVCAELARSAAFFRVRVGSGIGPEELASALDRHVRERLTVHAAS